MRGWVGERPLRWRRSQRDRLRRSGRRWLMTRVRWAVRTGCAARLCTCVVSSEALTASSRSAEQDHNEGVARTRQ